VSFWKKKKSDIKLIVGLGNPGRRYAHSRHNIGFMCLNRFARKHGIRFDRRQCKSRVGSGKIADSEAILARPQVFMNRSGESVGALVKKFKVSPDNLIVIHDDLDLPLGRIRIRQGGSSAGHKGIGSIINHTGSPDFNRIRVGIGRPLAKEGSIISEADIIDFVLSEFTPEEKQTIDKVIPQVSEAIYCLLAEGLTVAMNKFNIK